MIQPRIGSNSGQQAARKREPAAGLQRPRGASKLDMRLLAGVAALLLAITAASPARAQGTAHGKVQLISNVSAVHPGQDIWLGLDFEIEDGWHTYWVNPGDSGQPALVRWQLPSGWRPGATLWPAPERIPDQSLIDYGYEKEVLLLAPIRTPAILRAGDTIELGASVEWLVCRDVCVPAQARVGLSLPVSISMSSGYSRYRELFENSRRRLPESEPEGWKTSAVVKGDHFVLRIETGHSEAVKTFFPLDPGQVQNSVAPVVARFRRGVRVTLVKSDQLAQPPAHLRGVLEMASGQSFTIDAAVTSAVK